MLEEVIKAITERKVTALQSLSSFIGGKIFSEKCFDKSGKFSGVIFIFGESKENCSLTWGISHDRMVIKLPGKHVHLLRGFEDFSFENNVFTIKDKQGKKILIGKDKEGKLTLNFSENH